jgi:DNA-binding MarR family transcriptional regulator
LNENPKRYSNIAQFIIAKHGNLITRVLIYLALNTDNETEEFTDSNKKIAQNIKSHKNSVSRVIQELKEMGYIKIFPIPDDFYERRIITWVGKKDWNDIRAWWKTNSLIPINNSVDTPLTKSVTTLNEDVENPKQDSLTINNTSLNTIPNTSFNKDKEEYIKINLQKTKK